MNEKKIGVEMTTTQNTKLTYSAERDFLNSSPQFNWILPDIVDIIKLDTTQAQKLLTRAGKTIINSSYFKFLESISTSRVSFSITEKPKKYILQNSYDAHNGVGLIVSTYNNKIGKGRACCSIGMDTYKIMMSMNNASWNDQTLIHEIAHIRTDEHNKNFRDRELALTGFFRSHAYQELLYRSYLKNNASVTPIVHSEKCIEDMKLTMEGFTSVDFDNIRVGKSCTYKTNKTKAYADRLTWQSDTDIGYDHWTKITEEEINKYKKGE